MAVQLGGYRSWGGDPHFLRRVTNRTASKLKGSSLWRGAHRPGERVPQNPHYGVGGEQLTSK